MTGRILLAAALCLCAGWYGYRRGVDAAETRGRAALAEQAAAVAREREASALAASQAERAARLRVERESARAVALAAEVDENRKRLAAERRAFNRRMARVAQDVAPDGAVLSDVWVRLYNEALGLAPAAGGDPGASASATAPAAGTAFAADAGLRSGTSLEDLLAHARDYGGYCRSLRAQAEALVAVERGRTETP